MRCEQVPPGTLLGEFTVHNYCLSPLSLLSLVHAYLKNLYSSGTNTKTNSDVTKLKFECEF